jgi:hypothetical protein
VWRKTTFIHQSSMVHFNWALKRDF